MTPSTTPHDYDSRVTSDQDRQGLLSPREKRRKDHTGPLTPQVQVLPSTTSRGSMTGASSSHFTTTGESLPSPLSTTSHGHHGSQSRSQTADGEDNDSEQDYMDAMSLQLDPNDEGDDDDEEEEEEEEEERTIPSARDPRRRNLNHRDNYDNDNVLSSVLRSSTRPPTGIKSVNRGVVRDNRPAVIETNADQLHQQRRQANTAAASYALLLDFGPESFA